MPLVRKIDAAGNLGGLLRHPIDGLIGGTGCCCRFCAFSCDGLELEGEMPQFYVDITGTANRSPVVCATCSSLDGTYLLSFGGKKYGAGALPSGCFWVYLFPTAICNVLSLTLWLAIHPTGNQQQIYIEFHNSTNPVPNSGTVLHQFFKNAGLTGKYDCLNITKDPITGLNAYTTPPFFSTICNSSITTPTPRATPYTA